MATNLKYLSLVALGVLIGLSVQSFAAKPTDVRVGPTAAIGVSSSCDGKVVYVANGNGIFKSSDGGTTWTQVY